MQTHVCQHCGELFDTNRYHARYCSNKCRTAAYRSRQKQKDDWLMAACMSIDDRETFYAIRTASDIAAKLINEIANTYGPEAGRLATYAAWNAYLGEMAKK